jgi:hypothetical protein
MKRKKIVLLLFMLLIAWIAIDIYYPFKTDITKIDPVETAKLEGGMWRSYYEKKPLKLFMQSARLMRDVFHVPFWRSYLVSYYNAKAAFIFKDGHNRGDYEKALPYLTIFYQHISNISEAPFNADSVAKSDLEWWIIRRYRKEHPPAEWEKYILETSAIMYHVSSDNFKDYAHYEVEAMLLRDKKDKNITEQDWQEINHLLLKARQSFSEAIKQ